MGQYHRLAAFSDVPTYPNNSVSLKKITVLIQVFKYNSIKINWAARYAGGVTGFKYTFNVLICFHILMTDINHKGLIQCSIAEMTFFEMQMCVCVCALQQKTH